MYKISTHHGYKQRYKPGGGGRVENAPLRLTCSLKTPVIIGLSVGLSFTLALRNPHGDKLCTTSTSGCQDGTLNIDVIGMLIRNLKNTPVFFEVYLQ